MGTNRKPVLLLVPGAWHTPTHYQPFISALEGKGYQVATPSLPSGEDKTPPDPPAADIARIATVAHDLADSGNEVVFIAHSSGGIFAAEAASGLGVSTREAQGLTGGVRSIIFVSAMVRLAGKQPEWGESDGMEPLCYPENGFLVLNTKAHVAEYLYSDVPRDQWQSLISSLVKHPTACGTYVLKRPAYNEVDLAYVYCSEDHCFALQAQKAMVEEVKAAGIHFTETSLPAGHFPFLSMPVELAKKVDQLI